MAYDHSGDLPGSYNFELVRAHLVDCTDRKFLHAVAENDNFLNQIGHPAVISAVGRMGGRTGKFFADLGATYYEIATAPRFVDVDEELLTSLSYRNSHDQHAAFWAAYTLDCYDPLEMYEVVGAALPIMAEDAPQLTSLLEATARKGFKNEISTDNIREIKAGAALMRTLHMTAQYKLGGGDFTVIQL